MNNKNSNTTIISNSSDSIIIQSSSNSKISSNLFDTIMKQSEKLDIILKELYKYLQKDGHTGYYSVSEILTDLNIPFGIDEAFRLGMRLRNDGVVNGIGGIGVNDMSVELTSYGIDYCEQDSFSKHGSPLISNNYNINVSNSSGTSIIQSSPNSSINNSDSSDVLEKLEKIYMGIQVSSELNEELQKEAIERLEEIRDYFLTKDKLPRYAINDLLSKIGNVASIASLVLSLNTTT